MGVRRTIGCLVVLLLLVGAVGGSYVWYLWSRTDEMLHGRIVSALHDTVPDWNVGFSRARFDFQGQIRVYDLALKAGENDAGFLNLPETIVSVDRDQLAAQRLIFQQIRLMQPRLELVRDLEGNWNWQGLGKLPECPGNLPEWLIERGTIHVRVEQPGGANPATAVLQNVHLQLTPSGKRRYLVKGTVLLEPGGLVNLDGYWHLDDKSWQVNGKIEQLKFRTAVWDQVCEFMPQLRTQMAALPEKLGFPLPGAPVTDPRLEAEGDLFFRLQMEAAATAVDYKLLMNLKSGQWTHPLSPYPLDDVQGKIYCDAKQISVPYLTGRHGNLSVEFRKGILDRTDPEGPVSVLVSMKELPLEQRTRARLSPHLQEVFDQVQPRGKVNLDLRVNYSKSAGMRCDSVLTPLGCSIAHVKFPYPIDELRGVVKKMGVRVDAELIGRAGQRVVKITAQNRLAGKNPGAVVDVRVDGLPLDEVFMTAAPEAPRKTLRHMNLQGLADLHLHMTRSGDERTPWAMQIAGKLRAGSMTCKAFPLLINDFEGLLDYDGKTWTFSELKGTHGTTELTGEGQYRTAEGAGILELTVAAMGGTFDQDLEHALPETWKKLWQEFSPQGTFNCTTMIDWIPGQSPEISLEADLMQTAFQLKSFPFPIEEVGGHVSFHRDEADPTLFRADLTEITGKHEDTKLKMTSGYATVWPTGLWRVRLDDLRIEDLTPNNRFRRALPKGFREVIETLDPRDGSVALNGMLDFRGTGDAKDGVTSAWDLEILCAGTTVTTGIDLKHLYGKFQIAGTYDGKIIKTAGLSDLTSLTILGYQFANVKGPIKITGNQLEIGSRDVVMNPQRKKGDVVARPPPEQRITGRAIQGVFTIDGIAVLGPETSYHVVLTMRDALLERYAELYLPNQRDLRGVMTGEVELSGRGNSTRQLEGRGQLLIAPAALYQLPVMLAVVKQLNGGSPNNTAFDEAQAFFEIKNNRFNFSQVDLKGAALSLKGFGWVHFDRRLTFDFFSIVPRTRPLAILQQVVGQATVGWMGVDVRGTLDNPIAHIRPAQRLDDAIKRFLGGIDPRPPASPPPAQPFGRRVPTSDSGQRQQK